MNEQNASASENTSRLFRYELHMHTKETSRCARSSAYDMVKAYSDREFSGVVITDHFVNGYSLSALPDTWEKKMDAYLKGYHAALEVGKKLGIDVFLGWEYTYQGNNAEDYLTFGLDEAFLYNQARDCDQWSIERYAQTVHAAGGFIIRAHPYRIADYIKTACIEREGIADAIEVYNGGNPAGTDYDDKALRYAQAHGYAMVAGSDTHHVLTTGVGCVGFEEKPRDIHALCDFIRQGKAHILRAPKVPTPRT